MTRFILLAGLLLGGCATPADVKNGTNPYWRAKAREAQFIVDCTRRYAIGCYTRSLELTPKDTRDFTAPR